MPDFELKINSHESLESIVAKTIARVIEWYNSANKVDEAQTSVEDQPPERPTSLRELGNAAPGLNAPKSRLDAPESQTREGGCYRTYRRAVRQG